METKTNFELFKKKSSYFLFNFFLCFIMKSVKCKICKNDLQYDNTYIWQYNVAKVDYRGAAAPKNKDDISSICNQQIEETIKRFKGTVHEFFQTSRYIRLSQRIL